MVPGVGNYGQGAGIAITNLDGNPRPEMILMAYDNPTGPNNFRYKIGFNLNNAGTTSVWSAFSMVPGIGNEGQGAGIAITNLDGNPRPDMILMAYDNPEGLNNFHYKIGFNLNDAGTPSVWSAFTMVPGVGYYGQGAGVAITNLDGNPRPEMILMAYDNPEGPNTFRYKVGLNLNLTGTASWNWIPYRGTLP